MSRRRRINPTVDALRRMPLFEGCHRRELELVGLVADEVVVRPGFSLVRQADVPCDCFLLVEGRAEVIADGVHLAAVEGPALVGARSLRENTRRTASVVTTEPTRVFSFGYAGFRRLMDLPLVAERILMREETWPECLLSDPVLPAQRAARASLPLVSAWRA